MYNGYMENKIKEIELRLEAIENGLSRLGLIWCENCGWTTSRSYRKSDGKSICDTCEEIIKDTY
jgi:formylmethanofuran dehydrogenase subunit E